MKTPQLRLFEFHEQTWTPAVIRDSTVEYLHHLTQHCGVFEGVVSPFKTFLARTGATRVVDLCSGAGGAAFVFAEDLCGLEGTPPQIVLSDLFPRVSQWEAVRARLPSSIDYWPNPVDATSVPQELSCGSPRMIHNAFHHFGPHAARSILRDAVNDSTGIFISEIFPRNLPRYLQLAWPSPWIFTVAPILAKKQRLLKALLTWFLPVIPAVVFWDGLVSMLRVYTRSELEGLAAPFSDRFEWVYGACPYRPFGIATYFYGIRRADDAI